MGWGGQGATEPERCCRTEEVCTHGRRAITESAEWVDVEEALADVERAHTLVANRNADARCRDALVALAARVDPSVTSG